ncbi:MAG TPA: ABC transporter permease [Opitutaceae bacterium]|nr:ABC transporter permease [Opitutaceae bacterium]
MPLLDWFFRDLRLALRGLIRDKGFTATALLTFALCLGANVALFAVVNAVLIRPLPYPNPGQLVTVFNQYPKAGVERGGASVPHYLERRAGIAAFAEAAAFRNNGATIGEAGSPDRIASMNVTPSFFHVVGVAPVLGRGFTEEEGYYGKNDVIILSDGLWRQNYASDRAVVGRKIQMDGATKTIIGVMPPGFSFGTSTAKLWAPLCFSDDDRKPQSRHSNNMSMIARLRPGATATEAQLQVDALNKQTLEQDPYAKLVVDAGFHTAVVDLHSDFVSESRPVLLLLQAGVLFLLLIGAVNLANLLLVRASARTKEFSLRQVLGAGRLQLARQLITESLVLSLAGGLLGLGLGWAGVRGLEALGADELPHFAPYRLDAVVCLVALAVSVATGLLLALPVLWHNLKGNLAQALSVESRGGTTTRAAHHLRHALIVAQFGLAFTLLAGAGLLGISFSKLLAVNPGFRPENLLTGAVTLPYLHYKDEKPRFAFITRLGQELRVLPGVTSVGFTTNLAFSGNLNDNAISIEGQAPAPGDSLHTHYTSGVAGDFFSAMGIALREGRLLTDEDSSRSLRVCVVDEDVVRRYWPGKSALGRRIFNGPPGKPEEAYTVVGVVGAARQTDLADKRATGSVYFPYIFYAGQGITALLRTVQPPQMAGPALRAAVLRVDPELPVEDLKTMAARLDESLVARRSPLMLAAIFAGVAVVLAAVGIYGVLAYAVAQRRREIGVRMALGALPQQILAQFLSLGARLAFFGSMLGGIGGWLTGRAMSKLLFGVGPVHPAVFAGTAVLLAAVAMAACLLPAVKAARVPPMEALRSE